MAEVDQTSSATAEVPPATHILAPLRRDVDALKHDINDLRTAVGLLIEEIKDLKQVKVEAAASGVSSVKIEVKSEPSDVVLMTDSEEISAPAEQGNDLDYEEMEITGGEEDPIDAEVASGSGSRGAGGVGERTTSVLSGRHSTEEPIWVTPCEEILFRVNPEYAQRTAGMDSVALPPVRVPTPPPPPREETPPPSPPPPPPPPPLRLPSPPPAVRQPPLVGIIPASQAKRKHNFELILPAKKFKAFHRHTTNPSNGCMASSSRVTLDGLGSTTTRAPARTNRNHRIPKNGTVREVSGTTFKVNLDPKIRDVIVSRNFLGSYFGVHQRTPFCRISAERFNNHGFDHFVLIHGGDTSQPPTAPGKPGLISLFQERPWPVYDRYRIFVRAVDQSPTKWQYVGLYRATKLPAWTPKEVTRQQAAVWARVIREARWGRPMVARIMLRQQFGREPTEDEVDSQVERIRDRTDPLPSLETITTAFENGDEKVYPWRLDCEGYEEDLQREIAIAYPFHEKKVTKPKESYRSGNA